MNEAKVTPDLEVMGMWHMCRMTNIKHFVLQRHAKNAFETAR